MNAITRNGLLCFAILALLAYSQAFAQSGANASLQATPVTPGKTYPNQSVHERGGAYRNPDGSIVVVIPGVDQRTTIRDDQTISADKNGKLEHHRTHTSVLTLNDGSTVPQRVQSMKHVSRKEAGRITAETAARERLARTGLPAAANVTHVKPTPPRVSITPPVKASVGVNGTTNTTIYQYGRAGSLADRWP